MTSSKSLLIFLSIFLIVSISASEFGVDIGGDTLTVNTYVGNLTNLSELEDTNVPAPNDDDVLSWDDATGMWIARAIAGITDTFALNWTTFLTHITWAEVMNGTLFTSAEANNGTYITTDDEIWNIAGNGTLVEIDILNNGTYSAVDTSAFTECSDAESYLGNGTCVDIIALSSDTDTFVANYSTFLTHISWATLINGTFLEEIWATISNGTMATTTYVGIQNTSLVNYIGIVNTSMKNYVDWVNSTNFQSGIGTLAGEGTAWYIPMWNDTSSLNNSVIYQDENNISIGGTTASQKFVVDSGNLDNGAFFGLRLGNDNRFIKLGNPSSDVSQISFDDNDALAIGQEVLFSDDGTALVELMRITREAGTENARIGINTTNPLNTLHVVGDGNFTENLYVYGDVISNDILPDISLTYDIGSGEKRWNWLYVRNISTEYLDVLNNLNFSGNVTASHYFGDGSNLENLPEGSELLWNANYSEFLTHISWATATNGTLFLTSQWNATNESYLDWATATNGTLFLTSQWNATNESYMTGENFTIQNTSMNNFIIDNNYTVMEILNNGSYYNPEFLDSFIGNYSEFLTHINWTTAMNGTLFLTSQWNATNESYALDANLVNGSYFNIAETDSLAYNGTLVDYPTLNNGTYSAVDTDTFVANYTTFLTHVSWLEIINGTFLGSIWNTLGNGTMATTTYVDLQNTSQTNLINLNNVSMGNYVDSQDIIFNDSAAGYTDSKLTSVYYNATESNAVAGTINGGTLQNTQHPDGKYDGITFNFSEVSGSPALDLRVNYTSIDSFNRGVMRYKTSSLSGDYPIIQMWNYDDSFWEDYPILGESLTFATITQPVFDDSDHIQDGVTQMRLYKATNGNTNNHYYVDWLSIIKGVGTPSGTETDPYSIHRDGNVTLTGNWNQGGFNLTSVTSWFLGIVKWENVFGLNTTIDSLIGINNDSVNNYIGTVNTSMKNYVVDTNNTLASWTDNLFVRFTEIVAQVGNWTLDKVNYYTKTEVNAINTSVTNTFSNYYTQAQVTAQNTSQTNYINFQNTSVTNALTNKLSLSGGTMTGNLTLGTSTTYLTNGTSNTAYIRHNGTGWVLKG